MQAGEVKGALVDNEQALQIRRELAAKSPTDAAIQRALALDLLWLGDIRLRAGDMSGAQPAYQEGLDLMRKGAGEPGQHDVSDALRRLAHAKEQAADWRGAAADLSGESQYLARHRRQAPPRTIRPSSRA